MEWIKRIERMIALLCRVGAGLAFAVLIASVLLQVIARNIGSSPVWTEELTRFALLYMVAFGAGMSLVTGELASVDAVCGRLPARWRIRLKRVALLAVLGLCVALIWPASKFTAVGVMQTSPALGLRMNFVHVSVQILLIILAVFSLIGLVGTLRSEAPTADKAG